MYSLILYDDENKCLLVESKMRNVSVDGKDVFWHDGFLRNIEKNFIVVKGHKDLEEGDDVSDLISLDQKHRLLPQEQTEQQIQEMVNSIMLDPKKAEVEKRLRQIEQMINEIIIPNNIN